MELKVRGRLQNWIEITGGLDVAKAHYFSSGKTVTEEDHMHLTR